MIPQNIFRAYDIRGVCPDELNRKAAEFIGKGFGTYLIRNLKINQPKVVVGCDARQSSPELHTNFLRGLTSTGCQVTDIGLAPTPLLYFANTVGGFDAGCNITASHNPAQYNGFKLIAREGHAVYGEQIQEIYRIIERGDFELRGGSSPSTQNDTGYFGKYLEKLKSMFSGTRSLKVVVDTGNGVAGGFYPMALEALGHKVIGLYTELDGTFPNHEPDPIVEKILTALKAKVLETGADLGLAFDGDGDRLGLVTEKGEFVPADRLLMSLTQDVLSRHSGGTVVYTVSNSQVLFDLAKQWGGKPVMCKVGHSYVEAAMHEH
ncbi:MAG: phosphomannomutase/phosphoglucomutase, partial [Candidatus Peregrinibacteria bacterium]